MENKACNRKLNDKLSVDHFKEAEKLIIAGIIARLNERYKAEFQNDSVRVAATVTERIFNIPGQAEGNSAFFIENEAALNSLLDALSMDRKICGILTQAFIMRIVHASRLGGCKTEVLYGEIERLKNLGLYLEDGPPPTPSAFIQRAEAFFLASPKSKG